MGQFFSGPYHRAELQMRKSLPLLDYQPQPDEEIYQLDTEVDQRGNTTVDHVFKMTREVYGQRARDLKLRPVEWRDYGIDLKKRPSPYDFPAFEHEEHNERPQSLHDRSKTGAGSLKQDGTKPTMSTEAKKLQSKDTMSKEPKEPPITAPKTKEPSKEPSKEATKEAAPKKDEKPGKKAPRLAHNKELDQCSLEDE